MRQAKNTPLQAGQEYVIGALLRLDDERDQRAFAILKSHGGTVTDIVVQALLALERDQVREARRLLEEAEAFAEPDRQRLQNACGMTEPGGCPVMQKLEVLERMLAER